MLRTYTEGEISAVAIKYRRDGIQKRTAGSRNPYVVRSRIFPTDPRRRLIVIYVGIIVMTIFILVFHLVSQNLKEDWLPPRNGEGRVVEKRIENEGTPEAVYLLMLRVAVPAEVGSNQEIHVLTGIVVASEEDWNSVAPGTVIGLQYRTDSAYERLAIDAVYADGAPKAESHIP